MPGFFYGRIGVAKGQMSEGGGREKIKKPIHWGWAKNGRGYPFRKRMLTEKIPVCKGWISF